MQRSRFRPRRRWVILIVAILAVGVSLRWRIPGGAVTRHTYARIHAGMTVSEARALLGSSADDRGRLSGRISGLQPPGLEPLKWFVYESWEGPEIAIVLYSDEATGKVVRRDAIERGSLRLVLYKKLMAFLL